MDDKRSEVFNAHQGKFGSQSLIVVPCKNLGLKLDYQQLRISIALSLGANICGTVYTVFHAPRVLVASHVMLLSILSKSRHWDLSTCLQCSNRVDFTELMANAQTVLPWFLGKWVNSWSAMSSSWMLLHPAV